MNKNILDGMMQSGYKPEFVFFWGHTPTKSGFITKSCLSQWWMGHPFVGDSNVQYNTAEHYMMAQKARLFKDDEAFEKIVSSTDPREVKALGRLIKNFDNQVWEENRLFIVATGNMMKFSQHPELIDFLLGTSDKILVEASPFDTIWGIGMDEHNSKCEQPAKWHGENLLGFALMEVRSLLRMAIAGV